MEFQNDKAIYLQIADYVFERILLKKWQAEDKIPSIRDLAVSLEVNPNTVTRTYNFLVDKGVLHMKRGIGFFIAPDAMIKVTEIKKQAFISDYLPELFKMLDLLNIDFKELEKLYLKNLNRRKI